MRNEPLASFKVQSATEALGGGSLESRSSWRFVKWHDSPSQAKISAIAREIRDIGTLLGKAQHRS
jgi:hypothetical protein